MVLATVVWKRLRAFVYLSMALTVLSPPTRAQTLLANPYSQKAQALAALAAQYQVASEADAAVDGDDPTGVQDGNKRFGRGILNYHARRQVRQVRQLNLDVEAIMGKSKRPMGEDDPRFPVTIRVRPQRIKLQGQGWGALEEVQDADGTIGFDTLTLDLLAHLSRDELQKTLKLLASIPVKVKWRDKSGRSRSGPKSFLQNVRFSHWDKTNAAGALALMAGAAKDLPLLGSMMSLAPDAVMFELAGDAASVIPVELAAEVLIDIMAQLGPTNANQIASSAANIVQVFIEYWAAGDVNHQIYALTLLIYHAHQAMFDSPILFTRKHIGILLGTLLAGSMLYAKKLKTADEQNLWAINSASNLIWASTAFLGVIPVAGGVVAALAGTISVAVTVWAVVYNKIGTRDFTPRMIEIEGHIELAALEAAENKSADDRLEMLEVLEWMEAAVHINGLSD